MSNRDSKGLEQEIEKANRDVVSAVNNASKPIVVEAYKPLFEKVKAVALVHMQQLGISELDIGNTSLVFRHDGNFYSYSSYAGNWNRILTLESLPNCLYSDGKPTVQEGFTKYQSEMESVLQEFRKAVKESLAQLV